MPYTLLKYLGWLIAALALGLLIGWWLWGRRTTTVTTETTSTGDGAADGSGSRSLAADAPADAARAELEAERDRLAAELADCRAAAEAASVSADASSDATPVEGIAGFAGLGGGADAEELASLRAQLAERDATIGDLRVRAWNAEAKVTELQAFADSGAVAPPTPDVSGATEVLGRKIALDDLKVVEGISPKIEELCHGKDIRTWWGLANTDVAVLRGMLDEAGPRFQMHDPGSWPEQGGLLAHGQWAEFKALTDRLQAGRDSG